jgi:hypothetical protein
VLFHSTKLDSWIVGPSAIGSEKGIPSSIISAPPCSRASSAGTVSSRAGKPAVKYATNAGLSIVNLRYLLFLH